MISARFAPAPSSRSAVLIRFAAVLAALASVFVIPVTLASAALGRLGLTPALETAGTAAAFAVVTALAARKVDPLRR